MGFFSKIWKGIKKGFKAVFKPIKKVFKSFGKFMNKLGIAGQIAMMFIPIPGLGALFSGLGNLGSKALGFMTKFGAVGKGAATLLGSAAKFAGAIAKPFVNVTKAVTGFFKNVTRYVGSKIPGISGLLDPSKTPTGIFGGTDSAWSRASGAITDSFKDFKGDIASAASMDISDLLPKDAGIDAAGNKIINYKGYDSDISDKNLKKTFGAESDPYGAEALKDIEDLDLDKLKTIEMPVRAAPVPVGQGPGEIQETPWPSEPTYSETFDPNFHATRSSLLGDPNAQDVQDFGAKVQEGYKPLTPEQQEVFAKGPTLTEKLKQRATSAVTSSLFAREPQKPGVPWGVGYRPDYYSRTNDATSRALQPVQPTGGLDYTGGQEDVQDGMGFGGVDHSAYNAYINKMWEPGSIPLPIMEKGLLPQQQRQEYPQTPFMTNMYQ